MRRKNWKIYAAFILLTEAVGALAGRLTGDATALYQTMVRQPPLSPPGWVFAVVWPILYALMAAGAARVWQAPPTPQRKRALTLFFVQLGMNFLWPLVFFGLGWFAAAFLWLVGLWAVVLWMIGAFEAVDPAAAWLQAPYLAWLTFAAYLNFGVWFLNR